MKSLDIDDYKYFDSKFSEVHARIGSVDDVVNAAILKSEERLTVLETTHKVNDSNKSNTTGNIFQSLSLLGAYIGIGILFIL